MADAFLKAELLFDTSDFQKKMKDASDSLNKASKEFKKFGKDISEVAQTMTFFGGAVTGVFTTAFAKAKTEIPAVDNELKKLGNSFQDLANNLAVAALPSLQEFTNFMTNLANFVGNFVQRHQILVNQFLKYSAIAVVVGTLGFAIGKIIKTMSVLIGAIKALVLALGALNLTVVLTTAAVVGLGIALAFLSDKFLKTNIIGSVLNFFNTAKANISNFFNSLTQEAEKTSKRMIDLTGEFARGFRSNLQDLRSNVQAFGTSVSQALENSLGEGIFQAITGRIRGLRSILIGFGNDIARAFSQRLANQLLSGIFGDRQGRGGGVLGGFGGLGTLFGGGTGGGGGRGSARIANDTSREFQREIQKTTTNLQEFQVVKDSLMGNFQQFGGVISNVGNGMIATFQQVGATLGNLMNFIVNGFSQAIGNIISFTQALFSLLGAAGGKKKGGGLLGGLLSFGLGAIGNIIAPGIGGFIGASLGKIAGGIGSIGSSIGGLFGGGGLPPGAGISLGAGAFLPALASGGIVRRPTLALIGESGPEAVVPLSKGRMGSRIDIHIDQAVLNSPSNMRDFVQMLREQIGRI